MNKYDSSSHAQSEEQKVVERLQHLLMRVGTIVEEADARYLTNSGMVMQLKMLSEDMYQGHVCSIPQGTEPSKTVQASTRLALQNAHIDAQISVIALISLKNNVQMLPVSFERRF
uniref:Putative disease resistance RPP13-like protein n=1 Tax=Triticum turgidum TaxID=4571 RepID=A0A2L1TFX9_TRITU|nr:putative disease resistance RPP13-like protein [Triticum turgidum]